MLSSRLKVLQQSHSHQQHFAKPDQGGCIPAWPRRRIRSRAICCPAVSADASRPGALVLEADGVVTDLHMDGHRVAFNRAFSDLGFDCANWTPAIYHDLLSKGDGTGEGLVSAYYSTVGWPTFLPTNEQDILAGKVHQLKQKQLQKMLKKGELPLRDGILQVLKEAAAAGTKIAFISQTCSDPQDDVISSIVTQLPQEVTSQVTVYPAASYRLQEPAEGEEQVMTKVNGESSDSLDPGSTSLAAAAGRVKQRGAQEFVERMTSALEGKSKAVQIQLDLSLQNTGAPNPTSAPWLSAVAATLGVPSSSCVAVASSSDLINAAAAAGMVAIAVPRKMAYAATYPAAVAKFESWGPGYCTWQKLAALWQKQQQQQQQQQ